MVMPSPDKEVVERIVSLAKDHSLSFEQIARCALGLQRLPVDQLLALLNPPLKDKPDEDSASMPMNVLGKDLDEQNESEEKE